MPLIYSIEKRWSKLFTTAVGALVVGLAYLTFNILGWSFVVALVAMIILTIGEILTLPFLSSLAMERSDKGNKGEYMGLYTMIYSVAHILAPTVGMQIASIWNFEVLWFAVAGISALTFTGLLYTKGVTFRKVTPLAR